jgi:hypothetical protein
MKPVIDTYTFYNPVTEKDQTQNRITVYNSNGEIEYQNDYAGSTAEEWLQLNGYGGTQLTTLLSLQISLGSQGKSSEKLNEVHDWTNQILSSFITNPEIRLDWPECPHEFYDTAKEAFDILNQTEEQ